MPFRRKYSRFRFRSALYITAMVGCLTKGVDEIMANDNR
jgi:hypothetical protein